MIYKTPWFMQDDIDRMDEKLTGIGVQDLGFFRPPYGDKLIALPIMLNINHKKLVTWNVDPQAQYEQKLDPELAVKQVMEQLKPGSIVCLHDGRNSDPTTFMKMMTEMVAQLKEAGYSFVTVEEGLKRYGQGE
jgi:peptidoglycan/xylan/chitin deacetylase (PgdA/CDA1 family)